MGVDKGLRRSAGEVNLVERPKLRALDDLVPQPSRKDDREGDVAGDKVLRLELSNERREAVEENDRAEGGDTDPGEVGLPEAAEGEVAAVDACRQPQLTLGTETHLAP